MKGQPKARDVSLTKQLEADKTVVMGIYPGSTVKAFWTLKIEVTDANRGSVAITFCKGGETAYVGRSAMILFTSLDEVEDVLNISRANYEASLQRDNAVHSWGYGTYYEMVKLLEKGGRDDVRSKRS